MGMLFDGGLRPLIFQGVFATQIFVDKVFDIVVKVVAKVCAKVCENVCAKVCAKVARKKGFATTDQLLHKLLHKHLHKLLHKLLPSLTAHFNLTKSKIPKNLRPSCFAKVAWKPLVDTTPWDTTPSN